MLGHFRTACLTTVLCAFPALAQDVPLPTANPELGQATGDGAAAPIKRPAAAPTPKPDIVADEKKPAMPAAKDDELTTNADMEKSLLQCEAALTSLGAKFERLKPIDGDNGCGLSAPYNLTVIAPGVTLSPNTEMSCQTALATSQWAINILQPAAGALGENVRLKSIAHASTYICRKRNNQSDTKLSEHAKGNAIDISSFSFDNHESIPIEPRAGKGTMREAFQRTARAGACLYFSTVLGPGSDEYHDDHLHFDTIARPSGYRLCQ